MSSLVQDYVGSRRIAQMMNGVLFNDTLVRNSDEIEVLPGASKIILMVDITKIGTPTSLTFELEVSLDGGSSWFTPSTSWEYLNAVIPIQQWENAVDLAAPMFRIKGTSVGTDASTDVYTADVFVSVL